jgi:hypothetical protein
LVTLILLCSLSGIMFPCSLKSIFSFVKAIISSSLNSMAFRAKDLHQSSQPVTLRLNLTYFYLGMHTLPVISFLLKRQQF